MIFLIELFEKYVDLKILGLFLRNPNTTYHVKELSRKLGISPASASSAMKYFEDKGYLKKEEKGLAHLYSLNKEHPVVVSLKKAYGAALIQSANPQEPIRMAEPNIVTFALYGSYADGSFDEHSEIEFLIITPSAVDKFSNAKRISEVRKMLEEHYGIRVSVFVATIPIWSTMERGNDPIYQGIVRNHLLIYGNGIKSENGHNEVPPGSHMHI